MPVAKAPPSFQEPRTPMPQRFAMPLQVQIFDTDCYGVMWHGAYAKWLEMARCQMMDALGVAMAMPGEGYVYPVAEQRLRYRRPAKLNDRLEIRTEAAVQGPRIVFTQTVAHAGSDAAVVEAETVCVVTGADFKPLRRVPAELAEKLARVPTETVAGI